MSAVRDRDPPGTKKQILGKHAQADATFQGCCLSSGNPVLRHPGPGTFMLDSARRIQKHGDGDGGDGDGDDDMMI